MFSAHCGQAEFYVKGRAAHRRTFFISNKLLEIFPAALAYLKDCLLFHQSWRNRLISQGRFHLGNIFEGWLVSLHNCPDLKPISAIAGISSGGLPMIDRVRKYVKTFS